jgi:uncharacterized membrane protein
MNNLNVCTSRRASFLVAVCGAVLAAASAARADHTRFEGLGTIPGGATFAVAISADGSTVGGNLGSSSLGGQGFVWTRSTGIVRIGRFGISQVNTTVLGISGDGATLVGFTDPTSTAPNGQAFRFTTAYGLQPIPGNLAYAASFDGSVIVGETSMPATNSAIAFRWTALTGPVELGTLSGDESGHSGARAVSADGFTITGYTDPFIPVANRSQAFSWSPQTLTLGLGWLSGGGQASIGTAISPDGTIIVGESDSSLGRQAFRWNVDEGMVSLGGPEAGFLSSRALAVSADGSTIVGSGVTAGGPDAFIWTATGGMRSLRSALIIERGISLAGWTLTAARGLSADGRTIVGDGTDPCGHTEGWMVHLGTSSTPPCVADFNGDDHLSVQDIFDFLSAWFAAASSADIDQINCVNVDDIFAFLTAWFAGCH